MTTIPTCHRHGTMAVRLNDGIPNAHTWCGISYSWFDCPRASCKEAALAPSPRG